VVESLPDLLKIGRGLVGITQKELAELAGISKNYVAQIEMGRKNKLTKKTAKALGEALVSLSSRSSPNLRFLFSIADIISRQGVDKTIGLKRDYGQEFLSDRSVDPLQNLVDSMKPLDPDKIFSTRGIPKGETFYLCDVLDSRGIDGAYRYYLTTHQDRRLIYMNRMFFRDNHFILVEQDSNQGPLYPILFNPTIGITDSLNDADIRLYQRAMAHGKDARRAFMGKELIDVTRHSEEAKE